MKLEVELKLYCGREPDVVLEKITAAGWALVDEVDEVDTYFTGGERDLIATEECLRVRVSTRVGTELTWKPPTSRRMRDAAQYWKEEVNLRVADGQAAERLLNGLGYVQYVVVRKSRKVFRVDEVSTVCLDHVSSLGWFVELETMTESADEGAARNVQLLEDLGLHDGVRISVPYRDLVKRGWV